MASKSVSPAAHLIRNSRLMAVPPPMNYNFSDSQLYRPPYPTHQAITTPESSRSRGDWGLKRQIPRKVDSQYLRYNNIDTIEHRTTFESSHDTVMTVKKWQEMDIPLGTRTGVSTRFESAFHGDLSSSTSSSGGTKPVTWGYRERFVQHMTPGEVKAFISKNLIPRRKEFEAFLQQQHSAALLSGPPPKRPAPDDAEEKTPETPSTAVLISADADADADAGKVALADESSAKQAPLFSSHLLLKAARHDMLKAADIINRFLQIPLRNVPLRFHPSGGLYYIYDSSYLENNPETGPKSARMVPARIVNKSAGSSTGGTKLKTLYIIGGFAQSGYQDNSLEGMYKASRIINVTPMSATFDNQGKVMIELDKIFTTFYYEQLTSSSRNVFRSKLEDLKRVPMPMDNPEAPLDNRGRSIQPKRDVNEMNGRLFQLIQSLDASK